MQVSPYAYKMKVYISIAYRVYVIVITFKELTLNS